MDSRKQIERGLDDRLTTKFFSIIAFLLLFLWGEPTHGFDRVTIELSALSPTNWAVWAAEEQDFFRKYDIDAQVIYIGGGSVRGVNAVVSKEVQFMMIGSVGLIGAVGTAFFKKNRDQSLAILRKKLRMDPGQEAYLGKNQAFYVSKYLDQVPYVSIQGVKTLLEFLEPQNPKANSADTESFVDSRIVGQIATSGFFARLYQ